MPYLIDSHNCVRKQNADGSEGALLKCFDGDEQGAKDYLKALYANVKDSAIASFSMAITKASYDTFNSNPRHWRAVDSDTDSDLYDEKMSVELFHDFTDRINNNTPVPEAFKSVICEDSWCGGTPYLSIAHYKAGEGGKNVPGKVESIFVDGNRLKSKGTLDDTELGRKVFDSLCEDAIQRKSGNQEHQPVRISIGFLDLQHKHTASQGGQEFTFTRDAPGQICPLCEQGIGGKIYLKGQLVHLALTRVPVNPRTEMIAEKSMNIVTKKDDAKSIVKELADELDERSLAEGTLVVRADGATEATGITMNGNAPVLDEDWLKSCYDPNTDSYNQDCLNKTLVANMVEMRRTMQTVKSQTDVVTNKRTNVNVSPEKSGVSEDKMTDTVDKAVLGGTNVPEKKFHYSAEGVSIDGDPGNNLTSNPLPQKAKDEEAGEADDSGDEEKKEMAKKSALDAQFEGLKSLLAKGASVDEINKAFSDLGGEVEKAYQPAPAQMDVNNLAEVIKSAVEQAVQPLRLEIATLKAQNSTVSKVRDGVIPTPRSLTIKQSDLLMKAQSQAQAPVRQLSQIQKLARKGTFGGAGIPDPLEQ